MMLAAIILVSLACAVAAALLVRRGLMHALAAVPFVVLPPLAGWTLLQRSSAPERSPHTFEVLGQYHRLSDTVRIASAPDADLVLAADVGDVALDVSFDPAQAALGIDLRRGSVPVLVGERPVNALPLDRRAVLTTRSGVTRVIRKPWFCWRCDTRYVEDGTGGSRIDVQLRDNPAIVLGADTLRLFRVRGGAWVAADPSAMARVDERAVPANLTATADTLRILGRNGVTLHLAPHAAQHRLDIRFADGAVSGWVLPRGTGDSLTVLIAASTGEPLAGTMPVLNPAAAAPGAARQPYGGVLARAEDGWSWVAGGRTVAVETNAALLLPGADRTRAAGHIVRIRQHDTDAGAAQLAVILAWLAGALAFAWLWHDLHPHALALRVLVLGPLYALVFVRGTLAFRAWLAPPHDTNSPQTFLALLLALPALAAVLHLWARVETTDRRVLVREAAVVAATIAAATVTVTALVLPAWRGGLLLTTAAAVLIPAIGLALVNGLLLHQVRTHGPLAAVTAPAQDGYTYRHFLSALLLLGVLGFLLLLITQLLRFGTLVAIVAWSLIFGAVLLASAAPRVLIRPRYRLRPHVTAAAAAAAAGGVAWLVGLGWAVSLLAFGTAGAVGWLAATRASFRLRPVRLRDLAGPPLVLVIAASLAAILLPGALGSLRVVAEYSLAIAGLLTVARIFAILWYRHTQNTTQRARRGQSRLPGLASIGAVALLALVAIYLPMAAFDAGLVLLFGAATITALFVMFFTMGARAVAVLVPLVATGVFLAGMFVRPASLESGAGPLRTAQIRYAATYQPEALQQHLLTAPAARPVTVVRTLQQYWGVRHFAAGGMVGRGYFGAAYADWIVPRPVALTENVFSTFLLSEHGWYGGAAAVLAYLALAFALLVAAVIASRRVRSGPRALLLVGVAAFWIVPALYIAAANGVLLPLTGQNMPMLGLLSTADVVLACWLAALGLSAAPLEGASGVEHVRAEGWSRRMRMSVAMVGGGFGVAAAALIVLLLGRVRAQTGDFVLERVVSGVEALVEQGALHAVRTADGRDSIAVAESAGAHPYLREGGFVRTSVQRANALARGDVRGAGCLDGDPLVRVRDGAIVTHGALCSLRSVSERRQDWNGGLATATPVHEYVISDGRTAVVLDPAHEHDARIGPGCTGPGTLRARAIRLGCDNTAPLLRYGTSAPVLESAGDAAVELNGAAARPPTLIRSGDHIRVAGRIDVWARQLPRGALSYPRWENAAVRRIVDERATPWLAQLDSQLARGLAHPQRTEWNVSLTLQPQLHAQLQQTLTAACTTVPRARRCSAVLADPATGAILAMAATDAQPHRFLSSDANLRNHPAASAIKPILAAAALQAYPRLSTLEVEHADAEYATVANTTIQPAMRAARLYPVPRVPLRGYIGASDNLYAATLGFIATSARGDNDLPAMHGSVNYSQLRVGGEPLRGQPSWAASSRLDLSGSPLATALRELFGVHVHSQHTPPFDSGFWEQAVRHGALVASGDVQRITPEPVGLAMDAFRSPRELAAFTIGGDRNRWNNIALVEAVSRIYSGRAVRLHVVDAIGPHDLTTEPPQFRLAASARAAVLDGMTAVTQEPWGTGYALRAAFPPRVAWRAKTGTLQEREWVGSILLFAGGPAGRQSGACMTAGIINVEFAAGASPDGTASNVFRDAVAPLLRRHRGWGDASC